MTFKKGHRVSKSTREKMRNKKLGKKHWRWLGKKVSYHGLHCWVGNNFGKPPKCEKCGQEGEYLSYLRNKKEVVKYWTISWANITGKYLRDRKDWIGLCAKCHRNFEKNI